MVSDRPWAIATPFFSFSASSKLRLSSFSSRSSLGLKLWCYDRNPLLCRVEQMVRIEPDNVEDFI